MRDHYADDRSSFKHLIQLSGMYILTFDIEEWYHFDIYSPESKWLSYPPRINLYLPEVLDLLDEKGIKSTFFCLGWIARAYPEVLRQIYGRGHEIACHTDKHLFVNKMNPDSFREDMGRALASIEDVIGEKVKSFRAPAFTIDEQSKWAFEILAEMGIETDCSIFPMTRSFGGFPSFGKAAPCLIDCCGHRIKELPINTASILGKEMVYCGGGYFRLFPYPVIRHYLRRADYAISYFHMRDFDYAQPRFRHLSLMRYFKSYYGLRGSYRKFLHLLNDFKWVGVRDAISSVDWDGVRVVPV